MPRLQRGVVAELISERTGLQRVLLRPAGSDAGALQPACVLTQLCNPVQPGDEVLYNSTAVDLGLGTGGWHFVVANLSAPEVEAPGGGHVMKLRYTGVQLDTGVAAEHLDSLEPSLQGVPVVACTLHSQVGIVTGQLHRRRPGLRVAYVMTDGGSLPLALSDLVHTLCANGLLVGTVTSGHAFGGDLEAVGVPDGLAVAAQELQPDIIVVGMGPGVVGTRHALGTSALEAAPTLDTASALGGVPILCVRASAADARERHRGVSHHVHTVLDLLRSPVHVPVPASLIDGLRRHDGRHRLIAMPDDGAEAIDASLRSLGVNVTTMGRDAAADPLFFEAAAAAADHALSLLA